MGDVLGNLQAKPSNRLETVFWAVKLVFLSVGVVSTFMLFKVSIIPYLFNLILSMLSRLPSLWISIKTLLSPPYIYILLNFIIVTIVASSSYHGHHHHTTKTQNKTKLADTPKIHPKNALLSDIWVHIGDEAAVKEEKEEKPISSIEKETDPSQETPSIETKLKDFGGAEDPITTTTPPPTMEEEEESLETLEETWRLITGEKGKTLKESETWDVAPQTAMVEEAEDPVSWAERELRKSDTFSDRASFMRRGREKSMSQDELNRRAEAFIKKFNNDMRLQRQESEQRYRDMLNRGF